MGDITGINFNFKDLEKYLLFWLNYVYALMSKIDEKQNNIKDPW